MYPCHYGPERPAGIHNSTPPPTCGYVLNVRDQVRLLTDHQTKPPSRSNVDQFNLGIVGLLTQVDTSTTPRTTWSALCATPRISEHHSNSITVKCWNVTKAFIMDVHRESTGSQGGLEQSHHLGWWPEGLEGNDQNSFTYKLPTDDPLLLFYFNLLKDDQCFLNCRIILRDIE